MVWMVYSIIVTIYQRNRKYIRNGFKEDVLLLSGVQSRSIEKSDLVEIEVKMDSEYYTNVL